METNYIVVFNDRKKGEASATLLCEQMNAGALIISMREGGVTTLPDNRKPSPLVVAG